MKGSIRASTSASAKNGNARAMQNLLNKYFFLGEGQVCRGARAELHKNKIDESLHWKLSFQRGVHNSWGDILCCIVVLYI